MVTVDDISAARRTIAGAVLRTPTLASPRLSALTGAEVFVKYENLQATGSFKERGAVTKLSSLGAEARKAGVIAMSAGNHAQAVAYHARRLGIPATIVMPVATPFVKVEATKAHGASVVLSGETLAESQTEAERLAAQHGLTWVHPYDDPAVIAGQGTVGLEMLEEVPDLQDLVVPIGGGGLIAGCALAARSVRPDIRVTGVEAALYPSMKAALEGHEARCGGQTLAEGIAVKNVGRLTLPIVREHVDAVLLVEEEAIERAVFAFLTRQRTMAEGAGAAGLAALLAEPGRWRGRKVGLVLCGGNIDPRVLAGITVRGLEREDRVVSIRLTISDQPGVLGRVATLLGDAGANILEVSHRRLFLDVPAKGATLDITFETRDAAHTGEILQALASAGLEPRRVPTTEAGLDHN